MAKLKVVSVTLMDGGGAGVVAEARKVAPSLRFAGRPEIRQAWEEHASLEERARAEWGEDIVALDTVHEMVSEARKDGDAARAERLLSVAGRLTASAAGYLRIAVGASE